MVNKNRYEWWEEELLVGNLTLVFFENEVSNSIRFVIGHPRFLVVGSSMMLEIYNHAGFRARSRDETINTGGPLRSSFSRGIPFSNSTFYTAAASLTALALAESKFPTM